MNVREACGCDSEDPSPYCTHAAWFANSQREAAKNLTEPVAEIGSGRFGKSPRLVAPESRDDVLRRIENSSGPTESERLRRLESEASIRRLYEPAPSPELRTAATDAVREVFITELCQRLDAIYLAAAELGGAVGEQIRTLARPEHERGNGTGYSVVDGVEHIGRLNVEGPAKEHHAPLGDFSDRVRTAEDEPS